MKIRVLIAGLLLAGGLSVANAQTCNENSSISHSAVQSGNFKDAYEPCMAVLKECPTLRYYTYTDAFKLLRGLMKQADKSSAEYKKYFDDLMNVHDLRIQHIPDFSNLKGVPTIEAAYGDKATDYLQYAIEPDVNQAYEWLKTTVDALQGATKSSILFSYLDASKNKVKADKNHTDQFFQDYLTVTKYVDEAIAKEEDEAKKENLNQLKSSMEGIFVNSGVADCESLQKIYGPKVEENKTDEAFLKKTISILKMMRCNESEVYFQASDYLYRISPTADAAIGLGWKQYRKQDYEQAIKYFDEALKLETDNSKKAEMSYLIAVSLFQSKKLSQARDYCRKAISYNENFGQAYILIAQMYASSPRWSDDATKNKCTFYLCIDKLQKAKSVDPSCAAEANKYIGQYSAYTPKAEDLFMQGIKKGDAIQIGGWIGESTIVR